MSTLRHKATTPPQAFRSSRDGFPPGESRLLAPFDPHSFADTELRQAEVEFKESQDSSQKTSLQSYFKHGSFANNSGALPGWRPNSLRKTTFFAFVFIHVACIATLAGLFDYSRSHQGLLTVDTDLHYLWTYAPTLFFTIVGACWSRVAYRIHQMQPWRMLAQNQDLAREALLVDYVTPIALISMFKAIRARHLLVVTALAASIVLQAVTILSTGLFEIEYLQVQKNTTLQRLDSITGLDHDFSILSGSPDLTIYSVQNSNLSYPEGTNDVYAVPKLSYHSASNATLTAPLDIFTARLQCEPATLKVQNLSKTSLTGGLHNAPQFTYSLSTDDCLVADQIAIGGYYLDYNYVGDNYLFDDTYGDTAAVTCSGNDSDEEDVRIRISVGLIHYNITWNGTYEDLSQNKTVSLPSNLSEIFTLPVSTNLLCVPQYGLQTAQATYSTNDTTGSRQVQVKAPDSTVLRPLDGVTTFALSNAIMDSVAVSGDVMEALYPDLNALVMISNDPSGSRGGFFPINPDAFFTTMTIQYPPVNGSSKSIWFDLDLLQSRSSQFFGSVAAQFASQYLRRDNSETISGTAATVEPRLVLPPAIFYAIETLLGFSLLAALALAGPASKGVTPVDPASIGGTTVMLCSNDAVMSRLHNTESHTFTESRKPLLNLDSTKEPTTHPGGLAFQNGRNVAGVDIKTGWWRPLVLQPFLRELILLIPIVAIVALETTLQYSKKHNGLKTIENHRHGLYAARLVPAVAFSAIHMLLSSLAFNVNLMGPFSTLRRGPSAADISLFDAPLSRFPLQNLWYSARKKQAALFCSVLMSGTAFFLVTVSSGLFVADDYTQSTNLTQLSWFQLTADNNDSAIHRVSSEHNLSEPLHLAQDNGAVKVNLISNGIIELNLSYPAWTFENLAFPQVYLSDVTTPNVNNATSVTATIPAVRASLQCEVLKEDQLNISYISNGEDYAPSGQIYAYQVASIQTIKNTPLPGCDSALDFQVMLPHRLSTSKEGTVAPRPCSTTITIDDTCPYFVGIYGYATDQAFINQSVIACRASYEQIESTTTFDLPKYVFSKNAPPIVDESTSKPLNSSDIPYMLNSVTYLALYNTTQTTLDGFQTVDAVTAALIYGQDGVPLEQIFQQPPEDYLIPNLKRLVGLAGAQYISYFYRTANSSLPLVDSTIPATLQMGPNYRLKQNATSTRILDALLAASMLFAAITIFTFRYRDVAKTQLGSVGGTWALVDESEFVRDLRNSIRNTGGRDRANIGSAQRSAQIVQLEQKLASEGYQFSLGWWSDTHALSTTAVTETPILKEPRLWGIDVGKSE